MELGKFVTNASLVCCIGVSSVNGSSFEQYSAEIIHNIESSYSRDASKLVSNEGLLETNVSNVIDISKVEASYLISHINAHMNLGVKDYFIPNKDMENRITLFITCDKFKELCSQEKYKEAFQLEKDISLLINDKVTLMQRIERVAFL